jgi:class 3 adenylate cyclase
MALPRVQSRSAPRPLLHYTLCWHFRSRSVWQPHPYPTAHEDDAVRAVRSGLEIVAAVSQLAYTSPVLVRIGIHTGPVMVGEIGAGERTERLALGETPNLAARVQSIAEPDTVLLRIGD